MSESLSLAVTWIYPFDQLEGGPTELPVDTYPPPTAPTGLDVVGSIGRVGRLGIVVWHILVVADLLIYRVWRFSRGYSMLVCYLYRDAKNIDIWIFSPTPLFVILFL